MYHDLQNSIVRLAIIDYADLISFNDSLNIRLQNMGPTWHRGSQFPCSTSKIMHILAFDTNYNSLGWKKKNDG